MKDKLNTEILDSIQGLRILVLSETSTPPMVNAIYNMVNFIINRSHCNSEQLFNELDSVKFLINLRWSIE